MKTLKTFPLLTLPKVQPARLDSLCIERDIFIMKEIKLSQGFFAMVDNEDYERVNQFKWHAVKIFDSIYAVRHVMINGKQKNIYLHWDIMNDKWIDHIDQIGINCQKSNMRKCTHQQNTMNKAPSKNSTSTYKGVFWNKRAKKWHCQICYNYVPIYLGLFVDEIEAAKAYDKKAAELFGEFAYLNFAKLTQNA